MARHRTHIAELREQPAYTISEVAHYLNMPQATTRFWATGQDEYRPLIRVPDHLPTLLSFLNLVELHVLAAIRREHTVPMRKVRAAITWLESNTRLPEDKKHPLLSKQLETDGLNLFVEHFGGLVNISQGGQITMREVVSAALKRIERDPKGAPIKLFPFTRSSMRDAPAVIVIDPRLSAGRPVIAGTGLATEIIADRYKAGESVKQLAQDYERSKAEIEEAIRCEFPAAA